MKVHPRHPHHIAHRDYTVLVVHPDGQISGEDGCGLFDHDCRVLSRYRLTIDGRLPDCAASEQAAADTWVAALRLPTGRQTPQGPMLPQDNLELRISRQIGDAGAHIGPESQHGCA